MNKKRIDYIDFYRGIGIILMVMGHVQFGTPFDYYIHAFHMPMFFFISGYLFRERPLSEMPSFLSKKARAMLLPYFFFAAFHVFYWATLKGQNLKTDELAGAVKAFLIGDSDHYVIAGALWFLLALFLVEVIYCFICILFRSELLQHAVVLVLFIIGCRFRAKTGIKLPWHLDSALIGLGLFHTARMIRKYSETRVIKAIFKIPVPVVFLSGVILSWWVMKTPFINVRVCMIPKIHWFYLNAVLASLIILRLSEYLDAHMPEKSIGWIRTIGRDSIVYVCLNQFAIYAVMRQGFGLSGFVLHAYALLLVMILLWMMDQSLMNSSLKIVFGK